jgi:GNAT superfamily N-acetyltransferase
VLINRTTATVPATQTSYTNQPLLALGTWTVTVRALYGTSQVWYADSAPINISYQLISNMCWVPGELQVALAADRAIRRRAAAETIGLDEGLVLRHPELDDVHYLNAVLLDDTPPATAQLDGPRAAALAECWLADRGHRHVVFDDAAAGEQAAVELAPAGWERSRMLFMTYAADPAQIVGDPRARAISDEEMEELQLSALREEAPGVDARSGLVARLVATQRRLRETTPSRCFGAGEPDSGLGSICALFFDEDVAGRRVATVEEVGTLVAHRRRGLARAVVLAAVAEAARWGAEMIVVPADADDWPQVMYAGLGFVPLGRQVGLARRLRLPSRSVSGGV